MSCSGQKRPFGNFPGSVRPLLYPMEPGRQPTVPRETRLRVEAALALSLVDLFDDRPFARFNHIGSLVALDVAILTQPRGFPIDGFGEGSDLHGLRQAFPDPDPVSRGAAAGGAVFCPGRTSVFADDLAILAKIRAHGNPWFPRSYHWIPKFAGNEKERQGLRQRADFARIRRNSCGNSPSRCWPALARCLLVAQMLLTAIPAANTQTRICCSQFGWSVMTAVDAIAPVAAA